MSILRLSVMKERATAPNKRGEFIADTYRSDRRTGDLGDIPETEAINGKSALMRHLQRTLEDPLGPAGKLGADAPVTVMVHGFLFDPASGGDARPRRQRQSARAAVPFHERQ